MSKDFQERVERQKEIKRQANDYADDAILHTLIANGIGKHPLADAIHQDAMKRRNG